MCAASRTAPRRSPRPSRIFRRARIAAAMRVATVDDEQERSIRGSGAAGVLRHPPRLLPLTNEHERHGTAAERRRLDAKRPIAIGPFARPRRARVGCGQPCPHRLGRLQRRLIEAGQLKERRPIDRGRAHRRRLSLRWNRFKERQATLMIDVDLDHVRRDRRRIGAVDDAGREQVGLERHRHERLGALPIPELQRRWTLFQDPIPIRRWPIRLEDMLNQQIVPLEADCRIACARLVPERRDGIPRLLGQHVTRVFRANAIEWAVAKRKTEHRKQTCSNCPEHRPGSEAAEACPFAGRGHHFR